MQQTFKFYQSRPCSLIGNVYSIWGAIAQLVERPTANWRILSLKYRLFETMLLCLCFSKKRDYKLLVPSISDTPQFRGGNPYFFSENLYQSVSFIYASMYLENVHAIHIAMQFAHKSRHCVIKVDS